MNQQLLLGTISNGKDGLLRTFNAVPDDKLTWKPLDAGRHALELFCEAAQTAKMVEQLVSSRGEIKPNREKFQQMRQESQNWSKQDALQALETNHSALMDAVLKLSDADLALPITLEMGGGMTMPLAGWTMMAYRTYISRFAQINYIQTLYGDTDSH